MRQITKKDFIAKLERKKEIPVCKDCNSISVYKYLNTIERKKEIPVCKLCYIDLLGGQDI